MNILVDENIPLITVEYLRKLGHIVIDIRGTPEQGISDQQLWDKVCKEKCLLITTDKGFTFYRTKNLYGILIVSLHKPNRDRINKRIIEALKLFSPQQWKGLLVAMRDDTMSTWQLNQQ